MLKVLDLFAGVGGFSVGLHATGGFTTTEFCEIDKHCHRVLNKNFNNPIIHTDITKLAKDSVGTIDVIVGSPPCQDISIGGKQKGIIDGNRSALWKEYSRLLGEIKPRWCVIENVGQLTRNGLGVVLHDLKQIGYDAEWHVIEATHVGLPHRRERCYIIAHSSSLRLHERLGQERYVQVDQDRQSKETNREREERQLESIKVCQILSDECFDSFRASRPDTMSSVSKLHRVTYGIPSRLDESMRKHRIKQLGNAVVPQIAEVIGKRILELEGLLK